MMKTLFIIWLILVPTLAAAQAIPTPTPTVVTSPSPTATPTVIAPNVSSIVAALATPQPVATPGPTCQLQVRDLNATGPAKGLAKNILSNGTMAVSVGDQVSCTSGIGSCTINNVVPATAGPWTIDQAGAYIFSATCGGSTTVMVVAQ